MASAALHRRGGRARTSVSFDDVMPYAASTCLDCHSERAVPGSASSMSARATFAAGQRRDRRVGERRAVASGEPPVVGVGACGLHAVAERAEDGQSAVEQRASRRCRRCPGAQPHTTKIGLSVVFATSMRSRVNGFAERDDRAGDRDDDDVDLRVGDDRVEDLAAAGVGDRRAAAVDRVAHPEVRGDEPVVQLFCVSLARAGSGGPRRRAGRPCARRCRRRSRRRRRPARGPSSPTRALRSGGCGRAPPTPRGARRGRRRG